MSASFDSAFITLMKVEGVNSDNPMDAGGSTRFGITAVTLSFFQANHPGNIPAGTKIQSLTEDQAKMIYSLLFWTPLRLDEIQNQNLAYALFDQAVNRGGPTAIETMQKALGLAQDGIIGTETIAAINSQDAAHILFSFFSLCQDTYAEIVETKPSQVVFLKGWLSRTRKFLEPEIT